MKTKFDGVSGRASSNIVVSSIDSRITGSLNITNTGYINIGRGRLRINGQGTNISQADLEKLYTSSNRTKLCCTTTMRRSPQEDFCLDPPTEIILTSSTLETKLETRSNNLIIENLLGNDSSFVLSNS